jgi:triosephosphate isomerase
MSAARVPVIAGNWKMYKTSAEGAAFVRDLAVALREGVASAGAVEVVVAPSFTGLFAAIAASAGTSIAVAAQNVFSEKEGAYTGEVSPLMLADLGVAWVIVGHSERRQYFGDTDDSVARKVRACLDAGLVPIMCVGESELEREEGRTEEVLRRQLAAGLAPVSPEELSRMAVAYEPIWAIGTGKTATPALAQNACAYVRARAATTCGEEAADRLRVLYGGSMKPDNAGELLAEPDIDGGLVGGASLDVHSFAGIIAASASHD